MLKLNKVVLIVDIQTASFCAQTIQKLLLGVLVALVHGCLRIRRVLRLIRISLGVQRGPELLVVVAHFAAAALLQLVVQILQSVKLTVVVLIQQDLEVEHLAGDLVRQRDAGAQLRRIRLMLAGADRQVIFNGKLALARRWRLILQPGRLILVPILVPVDALVVYWHQIHVKNVRNAEI